VMVARRMTARTGTIPGSDRRYVVADLHLP
jgi:hypothetical protein